MGMPVVPDLARAARLSVRRHARRLMRDPSDVSAHVARLHAALELPGSEPAQGALADIFVSFGQREEALKHTALQMVRDRLAVHAERWFEALAGQPRLPRTTPLATRWSVQARQSADVSTRARRCSVDDSRALAAQVLKSVEDADVGATQAFLHHCVTCRDNLAFMLARRALLRTNKTLPPDWEAVSLELEDALEVK